MSSIYLTLGAVTFQDFEVPEDVAFGGTQRVVVHELLGGGRTVDVLGGQPVEISFSGIFSGTDATARAQRLDVACAAGLVLPLGWDAFYYDVVITDFAANYKKPYWIPFAVKCQVTTDTVLAAQALLTSAASLISGDLAVALGWADAAGLGSENFTTSGAAAAQRACSDQIVSLGNQIFSNAAIFDNSAMPFAAINALNALTLNSATLAAAAYTSGYVARAVANISLGTL